MYYRLEGMKRMKGEVNRLGRAPSFKTIGQLEATTQAGFRATQLAVHVITGSLKASGRTETDFDGKVWSGTLIYGGASAPINPVRYAKYELARGGSHYFFGPMDAFEAQYRAAVRSHYRGGA